MPDITADQAQPGDVLLDEDGKCWQRGENFYNWSTFTGMVGYYGEWKPEYGPVGVLTLLARDGQPAHD